MPQISHAYAVGKVRVLERTLLSNAALERLIAARSCEEVARVLAELEWGDAKNKQDVQRLADEHVKAACHLLRECSAEPELTDCFLLKYDILNLKILVKARMLSEAPDELSDCGTLGTGLLRRSVDERNYAELPEEFRDVMEKIDNRLASADDPLYVDAELDKAYGGMIARRIGKTRNRVVKAYFDAWAELRNLAVALRCSVMRKDAEFARGLLIPGGTLAPDDVARLADEPEGAYALVEKRPYAGAVREALMRASVKEALVALERQTDDYLLSLIRPHRYEPDTILPLVGYFLAREREAGCVRLIVTAKAANVSPERLAERLRTLYA